MTTKRLIDVDITDRADGKVPAWSSADGTHVYAAGNPGSELDYVQKTSNTSITATSEATANTIVTATAVAFDGSTAVMIEVFSPAINPLAGLNADITTYLYDGSSSIGVLTYHTSQAANGAYASVYAVRRLTPSAATHTYSWRGSVSSGTGGVAGGAAGAAANVPAFIRITLV